MSPITFVTDLVSEELLPALRLAREFALPAIELRRVDGRMPHEFGRPVLKESRLLLQDNAMRVGAVWTAYGQEEAKTPQDYVRAEDVLKRSAELSCELGCDTLIGHTFPRRNGKGNSWDTLRRTFEAIIATLENFQVTLRVENLPDHDIETSEPLAELLREHCAHPLLRAAWRPAADFARGATDLPGKLPLLAPVLGCVCVEDIASAGPGAWRRVFPGEGAVPWRPLLEAIEEAETSPTFTLALPHSIQMLDDRLRERYRSYLHGEPGEALTRAALARVSEWFEA